LWQRVTETEFEILALQGKNMPAAKAQGMLYDLSDKEVLSLDRERQPELYLRKRIPVYIPFQDEAGNFMTVYAWVYVGTKKFWEQYIEYDKGFILGKHRGRELSLVERYPDPDPLLHNSYRFYPPSIDTTITGTIPQRIIKHVAYRNRTVMREINRIRMKIGIKRFLNGDL